ncbi:MAG: type III restriction endonuclease subunit R, partial [Actinomycetota bacterium]|nr:type III restriction endonuclease subunit R [Actinomycetota bacterium]
ASRLGLKPDQATSRTLDAGAEVAPAFDGPGEQAVAQIAYGVIRRLESQPQTVPSVTYLQRPEVQTLVVQEVAAQYRPAQLTLDGVVKPPDIAAIVARTTDLVVRQTIDIPRILVVPRGEAKSGFKPFTLELKTLRYPAVSEDLWIQHLRTHQTEVIALGRSGAEEIRLEDVVVSALVDFDDISYDDHAELLYGLASQTVAHFRTYLSEDDTRRVLRCYQRDIAQFIHAQMQKYYWEEVDGYEVRITKGFTDLKPSAYSATEGEPVRDFRESPRDKSNMAKYLFGGFQRCLYPVQKFQAEGERKLAVILDREAMKWFKPAKGQFQIYYRDGVDHAEYQPDFVAETSDTIYMLEPKARNQMEDAEVIAKKEAATTWCVHASSHAATCGGKPWRYLLIPHDAIAENMTLLGLVAHFSG